MPSWNFFWSNGTYQLIADSHCDLFGWIYSADEQENKNNKIYIHFIEKAVGFDRVLL